MYQIFFIIHQWVSVAKAPAAEVIVASLAASWVCNCGSYLKHVITLAAAEKEDLEF